MAAYLFLAARLLGYKYGLLDAITELAAPSEDRAVIDFFISCKNICNRDKTIAVSIDSYAFGAEMFSRLGALCDSYLNITSEKVKGKAVRTLEVRKINTTDLNKDNMISFAVEPQVGMRIIPYTRAKI